MRTELLILLGLSVDLGKASSANSHAFSHSELAIIRPRWPDKDINLFQSGLHPRSSDNAYTYTLHRRGPGKAPRKSQKPDAPLATTTFRYNLRSRKGLTAPSSPPSSPARRSHDLNVDPRLSPHLAASPSPPARSHSGGQVSYAEQGGNNLGNNPASNPAIDSARQETPQAAISNGPLSATSFKRKASKFDLQAETSRFKQSSPVKSTGSPKHRPDDLSLASPQGQSGGPRSTTPREEYAELERERRWKEKGKGIDGNIFQGQPNGMTGAFLLSVGELSGRGNTPMGSRSSSPAASERGGRESPSIPAVPAQRNPGPWIDKYRELVETSWPGHLPSSSKGVWSDTMNAYGLSHMAGVQQRQRSRSASSSPPNVHLPSSPDSNQRIKIPLTQLQVLHELGSNFGNSKHPPLDSDGGDSDYPSNPSTPSSVRDNS